MILTIDKIKVTGRNIVLALTNNEDTTMSRMVFCQRLKKEAEGLDFQLYPGALGQRIFDNISKEAWTLWQSKQTMLINEKKLNMMEPAHRQLLEAEMVKFLFEGHDTVIDGYTPPAE